MDNRKYLESIGVTDEEVMQKCLDRMEEYGDNKWWEEQKTNPRKYAYFQIKEPVFLSNDFPAFHGAVEQLIGRSVYTHEFGMSNDKLIEEAEQAYAGNMLSEQERRQRVGESLQSLADYAERNNK